jgi:hypothetical protein
VVCEFGFSNVPRTMLKVVPTFRHFGGLGNSYITLVKKCVIAARPPKSLTLKSAITKFAETWEKPSTYYAVSSRKLTSRSMQI